MAFTEFYAIPDTWFYEGKGRPMWFSATRYIMDLAESAASIRVFRDARIARTHTNDTEFRLHECFTAPGE